MVGIPLPGGGGGTVAIPLPYGAIGIFVIT
jgi:hypothetical protein